jgi:CRP-like cAMP-binding protein
MAAETVGRRESRTIKKGEWIIVEGDIPAYFLYKLTKGKVGIYEEHEEITSVEVKEGERPKFLGFMSTLSEDRKHRASVKTESEVQVDIIYADHIRALLQHDVPAAMRKNIDTMIETIQIGDRIKGLRKHLSEMPEVDIAIDSGFDPELKEVLDELRTLYQRIIADSECRDQN